MKEINNIWQFFENLNEYVYATDIETYEMVYMNRKTLEAYGLKSLDVTRYYRSHRFHVACVTMTKSAKDSLKNGVIIIRL